MRVTILRSGETYTVCYPNTYSGREVAGRVLCRWAHDPDLSFTPQDAVRGLTHLLNQEVVERRAKIKNSSANWMPARGMVAEIDATN
jgi:hypothetical protein